MCGSWALCSSPFAAGPLRYQGARRMSPAGSLGFEEGSCGEEGPTPMTRSMVAPCRKQDTAESSRPAGGPRRQVASLEAVREQPGGRAVFGLAVQLAEVGEEVGLGGGGES